MTDNYKKELLKYLTGKIENEIGVNEPQWILSDDKINNFYTLIDDLGSASGTIIDYIQNDDLGLSMAYGNYKIAGMQPRECGFVAILDGNFNVLQVITEFDSGTSFNKFVLLNIDEDGYIYGIDDSITDLSDDSHVYRFIMLNNVLMSGQRTGQYQVKLRASYYFPTDYNVVDFEYAIGDECYKLKKEIGSPVYYMTGDNLDTTVGICTIRLTINVGETNEWLYFHSNNWVSVQPKGIYLSGNEDDVDFRIYASKTATVNGVTNAYKLVELTLPAIEDGTTTYTFLEKDLAITDGGIIFSKAILSTSEIYISTYYSNVNTGQNASIYKYNNGSFDLIYEYNTTEYAYTPHIYLRSLNNVVFGKLVEQTASTEKLTSIGVIHNNNFYQKDLGNIEYYSIIAESVFFIKNIYNLYFAYVQMADTYKDLRLIFNPNNYNGLPYKALNSLVPNSGILYDNNDDVIFARNLYNKTVSGATTTSTVQIPNTLLNDVTIAQKSLIGQTNLELVNDDALLDKNIYETVDLNFSNTLIMRNDNNENNKIINPVGATRLNNSVSEVLDYENSKATKLKINYADDTNEIVELGNSQITLLTDTIAQYVFNIYVKKEINNIQIISFDENTVYQTINNFNLTVGKVYNITQNVEVL